MWDVGVARGDGWDGGVSRDGGLALAGLLLSGLE